MAFTRVFISNNNKNVSAIQSSDVFGLDDKWYSINFHFMSTPRHITGNKGKKIQPACLSIDMFFLTFYIAFN